MRGILYGVGTGPGDPELMTIRAVRLIRETEVIALPGTVPEETAAYRIAVQAVPELADKTLVPMDFPMTRNRAELEQKHRENAGVIERFLDEGQDVIFLTLGDVTLYSTFSGVGNLVRQDGYEIRLVSGVPSFCASAAALGIPLAKSTEELHILPGVEGLKNLQDLSGTAVIMKAGRRMKEVKEALRKSGRDAWMAENCGMPQERLYRGTENFPDDAGYFSLIIAKHRD